MIDDYYNNFYSIRKLSKKYHHSTTNIRHKFNLKGYKLRSNIDYHKFNKEII